MDRNRVVWAVAVVVAVLGVASAGLAGVAGAQETPRQNATEAAQQSATETADQNATETPRQNATAIDSCTAITESGTYVLTADVENASETCIEINASDVVLDGDGHTVDGVRNESELRAFATEAAANGTASWQSEWASNRGVAAADGLTNVTVGNLTVTDWYYGLYYGGVDDAQVRNVTARGNGVGISASDSTSVVVVDGRAVGNHGAGVALDNVTQPTARGVVIEGNVDGVLLAATANGSIVYNEMANNGDGVVLVGVNGSTVRNNTIEGSHRAGIAAANSNGNQFAGNAITDTRGNVTGVEDTAAVRLSESSDNQFANTRIRNNDANWTVYAVEDSAGNRATNVSVEQIRLGFTLTDVGLAVGEPAGNASAVENEMPVTATNLGNRSALALDVEWPVAATNETTVGAPPEPTANGTTAG